MNEYTITPARYAKGKLVLRSPRDGSGWKTKVHWLVENCGGRYVHRDHGYQLSARQAANFETLLKAGFEGGFRVGASQAAYFTLPQDILKHYTLKEALAQAPNQRNQGC